MSNIFVGNMSFQTSEDDLRSLSQSHGEIVRVNIPPDPDTGRARGFAFVGMSSQGGGRGGRWRGAWGPRRRWWSRRIRRPVRCFSKTAVAVKFTRAQPPELYN